MLASCAACRPLAGCLPRFRLYSRRKLPRYPCALTMKWLRRKRCFHIHRLKRFSPPTVTTWLRSKPCSTACVRTRGCSCLARQHARFGLGHGSQKLLQYCSGKFFVDVFVVIDWSRFSCATCCRVGQCVSHRLHRYRSVIVGWDPECTASDKWMETVRMFLHNVLVYCKSVL